MDLHKITADNWILFERRFPDAYSFLLHHSLANEFKQFQDFAANSEYTMTDYDIKRFYELKQWHKNQMV